WRGFRCIASWRWRRWLQWSPGYAGPSAHSRPARCSIFRVAGRRTEEGSNMLAGEAVVAIWNGIAPEARDAFHDWHINEHMPERVGIPGFRRGRRYIAADP